MAFKKQKKEKREKMPHIPTKDEKVLRRLVVILICICIVSWSVSCSLMSEQSGLSVNSSWYQGKMPDEREANAGEIPGWIEQEFISVNPYSRPGTALERIRGIVVHYVANPGSSGWDNRSYFAGLAETKERKAGAHFIIGLDGEIIQCVPLTEITYCSNNRNVDTVSIECCHPDDSGQFTEETYTSLVKLCRWLMERYNLDKRDVIRHYDVTGKLCPLYFVEHEDAWNIFLNELE